MEGNIRKLDKEMETGNWEQETQDGEPGPRRIALGFPPQLVSFLFLLLWGVLLGGIYLGMEIGITGYFS